MSQINLHTTPEFERDLETLMRTRGIKNKSEAIRRAVREAAEERDRTSKQPDWSVVGIAKRAIEAQGGEVPSNVQEDFRKMRWEMDREIMEKLRLPDLAEQARRQTESK